jgi:tetratricopeptide (TPR) repeat protein
MMSLNIRDIILGICLIASLQAFAEGGPKVTSEDYKSLSEIRTSGSSKEYLDKISMILSKDKDNLKALNALAVYHIEEKNFGLARLVIDRAVKAHPNEPALYNNYGVIDLFEGDEKSGLGNFLTAVRKKNDYEIGATNLGSIYLKYNDFKRSLAPLEDAHTNTRSGLKGGDENSMEIANNFGVALMGVGEPKTSKKIFNLVFDGEKLSEYALFNYVILTVDILKDRKEGLRAISKLKVLSEDRKILKQLEVFEERADKLE